MSGSGRQHLAITVSELLHFAHRGLVKFGAVLHQPKGRPEYIVKRIGIVANYVQAAAFGGPFGAENFQDGN